MTSPYGVGALTGELKKLARAVPGERNSTLNTTWFKISQLIQAGHVDRDEAERKFTQAAEFIGLEPREIRATMDSGTKAAGGKPRANIPANMPADFAQPGAGTSRNTTANDAPAADEPPDYDAFYIPRSKLAELPDPDPLIDNVLDKRCLFSITGRGGTYKTFLGLDWLASIATGQPWLGHQTEQAKVLYIVGEGLYGLDTRLNAWEHANNGGQPIGDDQLTIRRVPVNLFSRKPDIADLWERIEREKYGVVLFDTLQRSSAGADVNTAKDAGLIVATMGELKTANPDVSIGYVAHLGKAEDLGTRGSTALEDDLDIVWRLTKDDEMQIINALMVKHRDGPEAPPIQLVPEHIEGTSSVVLARYGGPLAGDARHPKWVEPVLRTLAGALARDGLSQTRIMQAVGMSSWRSMAATAEWLLDRSMVKTVGNGTRMQLKITDDGRAALDRLEGQE